MPAVAGAYPTLEYPSVSEKPTPIHGGDPRYLGQTAATPTPLLNLATGVNPWPWPVPPVPERVWQALPYDCPELQRAAASYYEVSPEQLLLSNGSQPLIQLLPSLFPRGDVLLPRVAYEEHAYRWQLAGHRLHSFDEPGDVPRQLREHRIRYLVLVSPNNPSGHCIAVDQLRDWLTLLPDDGLMVVDQAYVDSCPEYQANALLDTGRLVLLRSVGKFFGLPGLRLGAALGAPRCLERLSQALGPWPLNGAAQYLGRQLFADQSWQRAMRHHLALASRQQAMRWSTLLGDEAEPCPPQALFNSFKLPLPRADDWSATLLRQGILSRVYRCGEWGYLRLGLAGDDAVLQSRLAGISAPP